MAVRGPFPCRQAFVKLGEPAMRIPDPFDHVCDPESCRRGETGFG